MKKSIIIMMVFASMLLYAETDNKVTAMRNEEFSTINICLPSHVWYFDIDVLY